MRALIRLRYEAYSVGFRSDRHSGAGGHLNRRHPADFALVAVQTVLNVSIDEGRTSERFGGSWVRP
jgi:hypothetical protein